MFLLKQYDKKGKLCNFCSIVMFITDEKTKSFYYKRIPNEECRCIHYKNYSMYDNRPYPLIEVKKEED